MVSSTTYVDYANSRDTLREGRVRVVEGIVENFVLTPHAKCSVESFTVDSYRFEYSDGVVTAGFNQTNLRGGPIRAGLRVRISFVGSETGNKIARLEVAQ